MRVFRRQDLQAATGLSATSIDRLEARGEFPKRVPLSENRVGWLADEVAEWLQVRVAERDKPRTYPAVQAMMMARKPKPKPALRKPKHKPVTTANSPRGE